MPAAAARSSSRASRRSSPRDERVDAAGDRVVRDVGGERVGALVGVDDEIGPFAVDRGGTAGRDGERGRVARRGVGIVPHGQRPTETRRAERVEALGEGQQSRVDRVQPFERVRVAALGVAEPTLDVRQAGDDVARGVDIAGRRVGCGRRRRVGRGLGRGRLVAVRVVAPVAAADREPERVDGAHADLVEDRAGPLGERVDVAARVVQRAAGVGLRPPRRAEAQREQQQETQDLHGGAATSDGSGCARV